MASASNNSFASVSQGVNRTYRVTRAAAELALSAEAARRQQGVAAVRGGADVTLKYRNLKSEVGLKSRPWEEKVFRLAGDTMTVTGGVLSAIALPTMAKNTATSFRELTTLIHDPTATVDARLDKVESVARSGAGTIFAAQGVVLGATGAVGIASRAEGIAHVVSKVADSKVMKFLGTPFGKFMNVLLPIADFAVLGGEVIATRRAFLNPGSTPSEKTRRILNLGLASLKAAFWLFPGAQALRSIYGAASFAQLVLTLYDFWPTIKPTIGNVFNAIGWGLTHPAAAAKNIGSAIVNGVGTAAGAVGKALAWTVDKLAHPAQTWNTVTTEIKTWTHAFTQQTVGWFQQTIPGYPSLFPRTPGAPQAPQSQVAYAPNAANPYAAQSVPGMIPTVPGLPVAPAVPSLPVANVPTLPTVTNAPPVPAMPSFLANVAPQPAAAPVVPAIPQAAPAPVAIASVPAVNPAAPAATLDQIRQMAANLANG